MSLFVRKDQVTSLNILEIDPIACFKSLKGLSVGKLIEYIPIAPVLTINKDDNRIIEGKNILDGLNKDVNLAAMSWEDFEHLIRELFEKEFASKDVEVKVTQSTRDRGVDAIAYFNDPLMGGKYVIQAKRYTSTVDVSAVRDLYGTVLNEGANKGILVTTSTFGSDSYEFIKDKPLSLINGSNLLSLLKKHGYNFKIDIEQAKALIKKS